LKIAPEEASVLSNLGLSYMLSNELPKAEETLRRAYAKAASNPRVRINLAVVVGLQGRLAEADSIVRAGLPEDQARPSAAYLKQILARREQARADKITPRGSGRSD
jgi:Flp pilus assembly protein TadD